VAIRRSRRHGRSRNQYRQAPSNGQLTISHPTIVALIHPGGRLGPAGTALKYGPATHLVTTYT
jgi:hypothetical protein